MPFPLHPTTETRKQSPKIKVEESSGEIRRKERAGNRLVIYTERIIFHPELLADANDSTFFQECFFLINSKDFTMFVSELWLASQTR